MDIDTLSHVRRFGADAIEALDWYVFGGMFGPSQVPRGIERAVAAQFLIDTLQGDSPPSAFAKALSVMCFYELGDITEQIVRSLKNPLESREEIERAMCVVQIGVEFGPDDMPQRASQYLDQTVITSPHARECLKALIATRVALAPLGDMAALRARLDAEIAAAEAAVTDEPTLMAYDAMVAIRNNQLPRAEHQIERKSAILALPPQARIAELVAVYLGLADISDPATEAWSGRLLRRYVLAADADAEASAQIHGLLQEHLAPFNADSEPDDGQAFLFERAAQALAYLDGELAAEHQQLLERIKPVGIHFLSDEL
ncbi:MAG: hypothetical protein AB8B93_06015 [Pseudomonadales bacterium]